MSQIRFNFQDEPQLVVETGANQISWGYGLNAVTTPTYGGEVVQILSAYIDDLNIEGEVRTYAEAEKIYRWFLRYIHKASQAGDFEATPIRVSYDERGWEMDVRLTSLPGFRLATEVVAPMWQIQASVLEPDPAMIKITLAEAQDRGFNFGRIHAGIGYDDDNPFTDPGAKSKDYDPKDNLTEIADFYTGLIPAWLEGDFDTLYQSFYGSKPAKKQKNQSGKDEEPTKVLSDNDLKKLFAGSK